MIEPNSAYLFEMALQIEFMSRFQIVGNVNPFLMKEHLTNNVIIHLIGKETLNGRAFNKADFFRKNI